MSINFSKPAPLFYRKDVDGSTYLSESIYQLFPANFSLSSLSLTKRVSIKLTISSWSLPNLFDSAFEPYPPKLFFPLSSEELIAAGFSWINFAIFCSFGWYPFRGTAKTGALECARSLHSNKDWSMQISLKESIIHLPFIACITFKYHLYHLISDLTESGIIGM